MSPMKVLGYIYEYMNCNMLIDKNNLKIAHTNDKLYEALNIENTGQIKLKEIYDVLCKLYKN